VIVRERTESDLDACLELARVVNETDDYPVYLPADLRSFLFPAQAIAAWVAEIDGHIVGHVALHQRGNDTVMQVVADVTGLPADRFGVVARLIVAPEARRLGVGRVLLQTAADDAVDRGLQPMLDVVTRHSAAVRLYEDAKWIRVAEVVVQFGDVEVEELVYLAPSS
jgi:GNAT superfamily N-acetyltransferase